MNSINKEKTLYTIINSDLQKSNDKVIQNFLSHFKHYEMKEELKNINKDIISEKVLTPDLVLHNKIFDKNNCFYESNNILKKNYFPRQVFKLNLGSDNNEDNSSIKFESKNSSDSLESKKSEEISEDKNGSSEEEEEEEDEEENVEIRTNQVDYENNYNNNIINEYNNNYNNNPQQILNQKQAMEYIFNSNENFFLNFMKFCRGGNQNLEQKDEALFTLFEKNMDCPGWRIKIMKNGFINKKFTTFELFEFLTEIITKNLRLDNFFIFNETTNDNFKGGIFYFVLKSFLMNYFNSQNMQVEQMKYLVQFNQLNNFKENNNNYNNEDMQENHQLNYLTNGYFNSNNNDYQSFGFKA